MQLTILGTSAMVPTIDRNHPALFLSYKNQGILFDCGEGTQRQLKIAKIPASKITKILISHWHGDHVLGLPGLLQTLGSSEYDKTLKIYGPKGTKKYFEHMFKAFIFDKKLIDMEIHDIESGIFFNNKEYSLESQKLDHKTLCLGYRFVEKDKRRINTEQIKKLGIPQGPLLGLLQQGKTISFKGKKITPEKTTYVVEGRKIAYIADTTPCKSAILLAQDVNVVVSESTYDNSLESKAEEYGHLTASQAAQIANQANSKKLVLIHFSSRYKTTEKLLDEAKIIFKDTICAKDFKNKNLI